MIPALHVEHARLAALGLAVAGALPHGGADLPLARTLLAPRLGRGWLAAFLAAYLSLGSATLVAWRRAPGAALASFLGLSALHFGETDARDRPITERLVAGAAPILMPALARPGETASIFELLAGKDGRRVASAARRCGWLWLPFFAARLARHAQRREPALVAAGFAALRPLSAFSIYFGGLHAPRALAQAGMTLGIGRGRLLRAAAGPSLAGLALFAVGYRSARRAQATDAALVRTIFIGLAALTVPHMALAALIARNRSPAVSSARTMRRIGAA